MNHLAVIFDMDGVLVDSYQAHFESWGATARAHGLEMHEADFVRSFGRTSRDIIANLWPGRFDNAAALAFDVEKEAAYRRILNRHFPEMPGAGALIAALHDAGFLMAIGSSGPIENVALVRERIAHGKFISATVNRDEVREGKPNPDVFLVAARKLGVKPSLCAVIEDAPAGIEAARRAEMVAIALTGTAAREVLAQRAHCVVSSLTELTPPAITRLIEANIASTGPVKSE